MSAFRQQVVVARPPVWERCCAVFGADMVDRPGIIFSWGEKIFNPYDTPISRELREHEAVHGIRQLSAVDHLECDEEIALWRWWERYLTEPLFRLDEELHAHHAEYRACVKRHGHRPRDFDAIAERLASPLYGNLLTLAQAKHAILTGVVTMNPFNEEPQRRSAA